MKTFKEFLTEENLSSFDELPNNALITEAGLSRVLQSIEEKDFAIITAYRDENDKKTNIKRNRNLRAEFDKRKLGVYHLVGHWQECSIKNISYKECPKDKLTHVIERSFLVPRNENISQQDFEKLIKELTKKYDQDGSVLKINKEVRVVEKTGESFKIGDKISLNKISQAYSQYVKKMNIPFVFEGVEVPATNFGRQILTETTNILYPVGKFNDYKKFSDLGINYENI